MTALKKWPGTSTRQSFTDGERLQSLAAPFTKGYVMDERGTALGWLGGWFKEP